MHQATSLNQVLRELINMLTIWQVTAWPLKSNAKSSLDRQRGRGRGRDREKVGALNYLIAASSDLLELPNQSDGLGGTFLKLD